jgi:uncharacterized protein
MDIAKRIAADLQLKSRNVAATIELFDEGNTLPFIARYRKEVTGGLNDEQLRQLRELLTRLRALDERRETILKAIAGQGKLTPELEHNLQAAATRTELEDLYGPFKQKRRTRASLARLRGLEDLAQEILLQAPGADPIKLAGAFLNEEVPGVEQALAGARDIVAEEINDHPALRQEIRRKATQWGLMKSRKTSKGEDPQGVYTDYYEMEIRVDRLRPHQILALNRGEKQGVLRIVVEVVERDWRAALDHHFPGDQRSPLAAQLEAAKEDAAKRLLLPAIERDVRRSLSEQAEAHAIGVFATNLRALLKGRPLSGKTILGIDPGYRSGSKLAVVDPTGKVLETGTIFPHKPQDQWDEALQTLKKIVHRHGVSVVSIGNGTASRETEKLVAELAERVEGLGYLITSEAGASVYSASPLAASELPHMDVSLRGAVSIARRVQDPLAEYVKIDPKSLGVGMYQHDVDQSALASALDQVVESVVNQIGVDVNTASPALLTHVAGVGPKLAENIVAHREQHGEYAHRKQLLNVSGLGPKAFEQAAGFLRVRGGDQPLDETAIHPESYALAQRILDIAGVSAREMLEVRNLALEEMMSGISISELAEKLNAGEPTVADILEQLRYPGRDPREDAPAPILRSDVLSMEDLVPGQRLKGTVRNVVDFGAFIDIGVKQDGLLHRSRIPRGVSFKVGDVIEVEVIKIEIERGRISLGFVEEG